MEEQLAIDGQVAVALSVEIADTRRGQAPAHAAPSLPT
jgi:hypothetical protein